MSFPRSTNAGAAGAVNRPPFSSNKSTPSFFPVKKESPNIFSLESIRAVRKCCWPYLGEPEMFTRVVLNELGGKF